MAAAWLRSANDSCTTMAAAAVAAAADREPELIEFNGVKLLTNYFNVTEGMWAKVCVWSVCVCSCLLWRGNGIHLFVFVSFLRQRKVPE